MKHPGHTYGGFVPAISEWGMTPHPCTSTSIPAATVGSQLMVYVAAYECRMLHPIAKCLIPLLVLLGSHEFLQVLSSRLEFETLQVAGWSP
jgi:hypothetical protein